jgi:hypothetical protein
MTLQSIEAQILAEYGKIRAFVMLHPWVSHLGLAFASGAIGYFWRVI